VDTGKAVIMTSSSFKRQPSSRIYDFLPPEPTKREVRQSHSVDVADAEFVVIGTGRPQESRTRGTNDNRQRSTPRLGLGSSILRVGESWLQQASAKSFAGLVLALSVLAFSLSGGFSSLSQPDVAIAGTPLHFTHVTATQRDANGMRVLLINGIIDNASGTTQIVRPIRADLVSDDQLTASVIINPPIDVIYGGQSRGFSTRVQYAGGKMPEVRLSFMP
jgi:hypothetical protein